MIKGHTDIDIWNTGFFINADYFPMISLFIIIREKILPARLLPILSFTTIHIKQPILHLYCAFPELLK